MAVSRRHAAPVCSDQPPQLTTVILPATSLTHDAVVVTVVHISVDAIPCARVSAQVILPLLMLSYNSAASPCPQATPPPTQKKRETDPPPASRLTRLPLLARRTRQQRNHHALAALDRPPQVGPLRLRVLPPHRGRVDALRAPARAPLDQQSALQLPAAHAEIGLVPTGSGGQRPEEEMGRLSNILREFNDRFGSIEWKGQNKIERIIAKELPTKVGEDDAYRNAIANSDKQNARIEHDRALEKVKTELLADQTELFKQFSDNESFRHWLSETVFAATYDKVRVAGPGA